VKVLIADDEEITRVMLRTLLSERGYDVVVASDGAEAYELLRRPDAPSIAILDWMMPGIDGIELCRRIRASATGGYTYVIIHSSQGEKGHFKTGMDAGADDYLTKPCDPQELYLRIRAGERIVTLQERLRVEARVDALTNTLNRSAIMDVLGRALAQAARYKEPVAVLLADIDNFKRVNDTYGHPVGDVVLQHMAQSMQATLRQYDALGRYGGEEFIIVSPRCDTEQAFELAERIRVSVEGSPYTSSSGAAISTTISIGVAAGFGEQLQAPDLILLADNALYRAKRSGRNRTELAEAKPAVFTRPVPQSRK
jgi:two-component system chemotaxis response regulator CheY